MCIYDRLTGLSNRNFFLNCLRECIEKNQQELNKLFAVLFLNLDRFQMVKYSWGNELSQKLLIATARRLQDWVNYPNVLSRMRDDEFIILLPDIKDEQQALDLANQIHQSFLTPFNLDGRLVYSNSSIGIVLGNIGYREPDDFLRAADMARHHAQNNLGGVSVLYDSRIKQKVVERLQLETDLKEALQQKQFHLYYQPIVSLETDAIAGFEALVRWYHPQRGIIFPNDFIPLAEETGLIVPLGQWALSEACRTLGLWQEQFPYCPFLTISVNLSGLQLSNPNLIEQIDDLLSSSGLNGESLKLEITESFLMASLFEHGSTANTTLEKIKERNIKLCIDDFGTGYSSLSYLHDLPVDILKIDRSFLNIKDGDNKKSDIIKTIIRLAKNLDLTLIAEGIENRHQLSILKELDCDYGQGYFFSRPLDVNEVSRLIEKEISFTAPDVQPA